jgi:hypothetical protein
LGQTGYSTFTRRARGTCSQLGAIWIGKVDPMTNTMSFWLPSKLLTRHILAAGKALAAVSLRDG